MKTGRKNNNSGFSLVELIIVIAIMAVLVGVMATSITSLTGRKVRKCADEIVTTLERTRVLTLGKEQNQVECVISYNDTTKEYTAQIRQGDVEVSNRVLGKEPIDIKVYFEGDSTGYSTGYSLTELKGSDSLLPYVSSSKGLHLVFNRASGAFEKDTCTANNVLKEYCQKIVVSNGTRTIEITTVGKTGKILTK